MFFKCFFLFFVWVEFETMSFWLVCCNKTSFWLLVVTRLVNTTGPFDMCLCVMCDKNQVPHTSIIKLERSPRLGEEKTYYPSVLLKAKYHNLLFICNQNVSYWVSENRIKNIYLKAWRQPWTRWHNWSYRHHSFLLLYILINSFYSYLLLFLNVLQVMDSVLQRPSTPSLSWWKCSKRLENQSGKVTIKQTHLH